MSCRVQYGAKIANDGSKRKPQTPFQLDAAVDGLPHLPTFQSLIFPSPTFQSLTFQSSTFHRERRVATETSISDVGVPGGSK